MALENHILDLIPAYVLGCLDNDEAIEVAEHLAVCPGCREELLIYKNLADQLPLALAQTDPPPRVKNGLMEQIRPSQMNPNRRRPPWYVRLLNGLTRSAPAWGLASLAAVVALAFGFFSLSHKVNQLGRIEMPVYAIRGSEAAPQAVGTIVVSRDGEHGALVVDGLPPLDGNHQYQLWLIKAGKRTSGGVFSVDELGYATLYVESPAPLASYDSLGVTIEPAGGSPAPSGPKVMGGEL